jgi:cysteine synthase A
VEELQLHIHYKALGAGFIPSILNTKILDGVIQVGRDESFSYAQRLAKEEGILVGISTGASLAAVAKKLIDIPEGATVLTFNYDTGERYFSIEGLY